MPKMVFLELGRIRLAAQNVGSGEQMSLEFLKRELGQWLIRIHATNVTLSL